jgi:cGMP-dependent protein kinase
MHVCNVGDSRAIMAYEQQGAPGRALGALGSGGRLVAKTLSNDQTPYRKDERERCKAAGARILTMDQIDGLEAIHEGSASVGARRRLCRLSSRAPGPRRAARGRLEQ